MKSFRIPFNRSALVGREMAHLSESIGAGQIAGDQTFGRRCEAFLEKELDASRVLLTSSCTHALELAAFLLDASPGEEVVVPSFTFVSTANAFAARGLRPRFCDVRPDTLNLDEEALEATLTSKTRAIVPVHYAGVACEMDRILEVARAHGALVVEDNAHGLFGRYRDRNLGTLGSLAAQSFHETKNFTCGEGGALVMNDPALVERAEIIREKGTDRSRFSRGEVTKYSWIDLGSSYVMSDLLASFLYGQLSERENIQATRAKQGQRYDSELRSWADAHDVQRPHVPAHCSSAHHCYYLLLPRPADRDRFIRHLADRGILAVFHYLPLHLSPMGRRFGGQAGDCPVSEDVSARLVRLPLFHDLSVAEQSDVIEAVSGFRP